MGNVLTASGVLRPCLDADTSSVKELHEYRQISVNVLASPRWKPSVPVVDSSLMRLCVNELLLGWPV